MMELVEIHQFLARTTPFNLLEKGIQTELARAISVYYFRANETVPPQAQRLMIVRTGLFARYDGQQLLEKLQEGDFDGYQLSGQPGGRLVCEEDALVYWLDGEVFTQSRQRWPLLDNFFLRLAARTLHQQPSPGGEGYFTLKVRDLVQPHKITILPGSSVQAAAQLMSERRVSSLLVEETGALLGIITDRDLRSRVLALGLPADTAVGQVMTRDPRTIDRDAYLFEALQQMGRWRVHHLPVLGEGSVIGMVTVTDLIRAQQEHPVYLLTDIERQSDLEGLVRCSQQIPRLTHILGLQGVSAHEAAHILATVMDALTERLIALSIMTLGPAPCAFSWLVFGSFARQDQGLNADQDNGLLLAEPPVGEVGHYFSQLAHQVCDGLARCGLPYCSGNIMATNPDLCLDKPGWLTRFRRWFQAPTPEALLSATVFFDVRLVAGCQASFDGLVETVVTEAASHPLFLMHLAQTAQQRRAPLGLFKNLILEANGQQQPGLDLKTRGMSLITDLVRVYALEAGVTCVGTRQRLRELEASGAMDRRQCRNLQDAFDLLAQLRWDLHLRQQGEASKGIINNHLDPSTLSGLQRHQLKECFAVINEGQRLLDYRFCRHL
jgi:CBS domain-containing protein